MVSIISINWWESSEHRYLHRRISFQCFLIYLHKVHLVSIRRMTWIQIAKKFAELIKCSSTQISTGSRIHKLVMVMELLLVYSSNNSSNSNNHNSSNNNSSSNSSSSSSSSNRIRQLDNSSNSRISSQSMVLLTISKMLCHSHLKHRRVSYILFIFLAIDWFIDSSYWFIGDLYVLLITYTDTSICLSVCLFLSCSSLLKSYRPSLSSRYACLFVLHTIVVSIHLLLGIPTKIIHYFKEFIRFDSNITNASFLFYWNY